jgi:hypothetical protein
MLYVEVPILYIYTNCNIATKIYTLGTCISSDVAFSCMIPNVMA